MKTTGLKTVAHATVERLVGGQPSRARSGISAAVVGGLVAAGVYKGLRSQGDDDA
jgi:hypothetical protein